MGKGIAYPKRRKRRRDRNPIPYVISLELAFLPEELDEYGYEMEIRRIVRENMLEVLKERRIGLARNSSSEKEVCLFEEYDDFVSEIIEEEVAKN